MSETSAITLTLPQAPQDEFVTLRGAARERFLARGWPGRGDESYKYTPLSALAGQDWPSPPRAPHPNGAPVLPPAIGKRTLWVDGCLMTGEGGAPVQTFDRDTPAPAGFDALLGRLAPADDPVVAINTALFDHGARIHLPDGAAPAASVELPPVELLFASAPRDTAAATHARLVVELGRDSRLVLIERHAGAAAETLNSRVAEISLAVGAELLHIRLNQAGANTRLLAHTSVRAAAGAHYRCLNLDLGARLSRASFVVDLAGDDAGTALSGLALLGGKQHADADVRVVHDALRTRSRQNFRAVLDGRSRGVYTGRVLVCAGAQKTDSAQSSANLLLSPGAQADVRPQLEIYTDDVICNHGATTGALDPDALFYLESRGIGAEAARRMITFGFAIHSLALLDDAPLRKTVAVLLARHMQVPPEVLEWL